MQNVEHLIPISGNSGKSDEADVIEIERPPRDFIVVQPCDSHDKQKQLATSSSPSDGDNDDDEKEEERTNLIQDARQKGKDTSRLSHSQTLTAARKRRKTIRFLSCVAIHCFFVCG